MAGWLVGTAGHSIMTMMHRVAVAVTLLVAVTALRASYESKDMTPMDNDDAFIVLELGEQFRRMGAHFTHEELETILRFKAGTASVLEDNPFDSLDKDTHARYMRLVDDLIKKFPTSQSREYVESSALVLANDMESCIRGSTLMSNSEITACRVSDMTTREAFAVAAMSSGSAAIFVAVVLITAFHFQESPGAWGAMGGGVLTNLLGLALCGCSPEIRESLSLGEVSDHSVDSSSLTNSFAPERIEGDVHSPFRTSAQVDLHPRDHDVENPSVDDDASSRFSDANVIQGLDELSI